MHRCEKYNSVCVRPYLSTLHVAQGGALRHAQPSPAVGRWISASQVDIQASVVYQALLLLLGYVVLVRLYLLE